MRKTIVVLTSIGTFIAVVGSAIAYADEPQRGLAFTKCQSALWAFLLLMLAGLVVDAIIRSAQSGTDVAERAEEAARGAEQTAAAVVALPEGDERTRGIMAAGDAAVAAAETNVGARRLGVKALVVGDDGRVSTSKSQAVLWTLAILYVLLFLLLAGRVLVGGTHCPPSGCSVPDVAKLRVGLGNVVDNDLQPEYFALLGIPLGAAVAAKALTTAKVADGKLVKSPPRTAGIRQGLAETVAGDEGKADTVDFQYVAFNLFLLAYFFVQFADHPVSGLPELPPTLLALAGVSGTAYVTKKALEKGLGPVVSAVVPGRVVLGADTLVRVVGAGFVSAGGIPTPLNQITLDGRSMDVTYWTPTEARFALAVDVTALKTQGLRERSNAAELATLIVYDDFGHPSPAFKVQLDVIEGWN